MKWTLRQIIGAAGGQTAVAKECGISVPAVSKWVKDGELPGKDYVKTVEGYRTKISKLAGVEPHDIP